MPASSVVERSHRKKISFTRGPRFESRRGLYFSDAIFSRISHKCLTAISNYQTCYIVSRNLSIGMAVAAISTEWRGNVALEIGPMTSSPLSNVDDDVIYSTTQFYTILQQYKQPVAVSLQTQPYSGDKRWLKSNATGQAMGNRERGLLVG